MSTESPLTLHDQIASLCLHHFDSLPKSGKPSENEWTTLSCIVQEDNDKLEVVALGTGSKCIGHDKMSESGSILNDSHAEVMVRRAFLRYLYENMLQNSDILAFDPEKKHFVLKDCLKFHFFTTLVPCGDAAIFPKQDTDNFGTLINHAGLHARENDALELEGVERKKPKLEENTENDIFRTGAKCLKSDIKQDQRLEGADYHITGVVRTKPGRGSPTLSVSCSDKLAKWCHLGVQGALLSILLKDPVYFSSFTIAGGTPYNEEALQRALFNRLGDMHLGHLYHRTTLTCGQSNFTFPFSKSDGKRPCASSIAWLSIKNSQRQLEVAVEGRRQGITKKQLQTAGKLKICKAELFAYFQQVIKRFSIDVDSNNLTYREAKLNAKEYQKAWSKLKDRFRVWTVKDDRYLQFCTQTDKSASRLGK